MHKNLDFSVNYVEKGEHMLEYNKLESKHFRNVILRVVPGHFVTPNSHTNYLMDMTAIMRRQAEAQAVASAMCEFFGSSTSVDTICCLEGMEVVGAYLANELTRAGNISKNAHKTLYIISPEYGINGQMIFRENMDMMLVNKNVLLILATATTGKTIANAAETLNHYGAKVVGISAIFSACTAIDGFPIHSIFDQSDLPGYRSWKSHDCKLCKQGMKVTAICNGFGYSQLR